MDGSEAGRKNSKGDGVAGVAQGDAEEEESEERLIDDPRFRPETPPAKKKVSSRSRSSSNRSQTPSHDAHGASHLSGPISCLINSVSSNGDGGSSRVPNTTTPTNSSCMYSHHATHSLPTPSLLSPNVHTPSQSQFSIHGPDVASPQNLIPESSSPFPHEQEHRITEAAPSKVPSRAHVVPDPAGASNVSAGQSPALSSRGLVGKPTTSAARPAKVSSSASSAAHPSASLNESSSATSPSRGVEAPSSSSRFPSRGAQALSSSPRFPSRGADAQSSPFPSSRSASSAKEGVNTFYDASFDDDSVSAV